MLVSFLVCCYSIILDFIAFLCLCAASSPSAHFRVDRNCPLPCLASYYLAANEWVKAEKNRIASNYNRVQAAPRNLDPRQVPQGMIGRLQVVWLDIVCKKKKNTSEKGMAYISKRCSIWGEYKACNYGMYGSSSSFWFSLVNYCCNFKAAGASQ